jgi:large conductance mechanosensitive channel
VVGKPDFNAIAFNIGETPIHIGALLTALVNFLIVAGVIYFCVVVPLQWVTARMTKEEAATTKICPECLSEIPLEAKRCSHCAQPQAA